MNPFFRLVSIFIYKYIRTKKMYPSCSYLFTCCYDYRTYTYQIRLYSSYYTSTEKNKHYNIQKRQFYCFSTKWGIVFLVVPLLNTCDKTFFFVTYFLFILLLWNTMINDLTTSNYNTPSDAIQINKRMNYIMIVTVMWIVDGFFDDNILLI